MSIRDTIRARTATGRKSAASPAIRGDNPHRKWVPVIDTESCDGCGRCIIVCEHGCLEMVWSFATLTEAKDCGSEALCEAICREDVIRMGWMALEADRAIGRWDE